ncbi:MAG: class I SAM-dependent methyltransferase [Acidobacteriia bacterium]|nr:class I SAM-dependent methyltransferase [Terriglobia bacterium]
MKNGAALSPAIQVPASRMPTGWRSQFGKPSGVLGGLIGHLMALKNKDRSWWVLPMLEIHQNDCVLEVGFGSGIDIRRVSEIAVDGFVAGVDHSPVMLEQATRRNRAAIQSERVELQLGCASQLPYQDDFFNKVFSINVAQFWNDPVTVMRETRRVLRPGGLVAVAVQPRSKGAKEGIARLTGRSLVENLSAAGFNEVRLEVKRMKPVSTVCALGVK